MITLKKKKKNQGINSILFQPTHFKDHTFSHPIDYSTSTVLFTKRKKKKLRHVIPFTSQLHIYHIRENRRERERGRKSAAQREREKAGGDQVSPKGKSRATWVPSFFFSKLFNQNAEFQFQGHQSCWPIFCTHGSICWELNC